MQAVSVYVAMPDESLSSTWQTCGAQNSELLQKWWEERMGERFFPLAKLGFIIRHVGKCPLF